MPPVRFLVFKYYTLLVITIILLSEIIIIICFIYSLMRFPYKSIQTTCYYKENPLTAYLEAKTSRVYRESALPEANPR